MKKLDLQKLNSLDNCVNKSELIHEYIGSCIIDYSNIPNAIIIEESDDSILEQEKNNNICHEKDAKK